MEQKKHWFISKQRGGKILIHKVIGDLTYNGQRIPIMNDEDRKELKELLTDKYGIVPTSNEVSVTIDRRYQPEVYKDMTKYISRRLYKVKKENPELYNVVRAEKIPCYFEGINVLLRSSSKDKIWIAVRKRSEKFPKGFTNLNHVCIDDASKKRFFDDADAYHIPDGKKHYLLASDGYVFKKWSDFMDKEYQDQLEHYKKD